MNPTIIFCIGSTVERWVRSLTNNHFYIQQLPHPAGEQRGFRNDHYRTLYFWMIAKSLYKNKIIGEEELHELSKLFVEKFEE